ncbi:MAG: hypothetical protein COA42_20455 [Alteromonadaceae bacterium]|nr:MAG: hypothetical protein COA42_20455 [Alteromonadaceae bacterium]
MTYSAKAVANLLIDVARENGSSLDQMKLQKLVYITHGWNLAITNKPLIEDGIQAWKYGPVIPVLYEEFKNCGRNDIMDYATDVNVADDLSFSFTPPKINENDSATYKLANKIWATYGKYSGPQLSNLTHMPDTPWDKAYIGGGQAVIDNSLIREHFVNLSRNPNA